ncbi:MAG: M13 family metallopeptidase [Planctomycetes bacterium]|nr:M13 family metallopeptidase [Planctomycetota bacterium]
MNRCVVRGLPCLTGVFVATGWIASASGQPDAARKSGIDRSGFSAIASPGEDFYQHVNGTWLEKTEIPADKSDYGIFTYLTDESQKALREIVERASARSGRQPGSDEQKVGDAYQSFVDVDRLEKLGIDPLRPHLDRIAGLASKADLARHMAENQRRGVTNPFAAYVSPDAKKSDEYAIYLTQSGLSLPDRDYYSSDEERFRRIREALAKYVRDLMAEAGFTQADRIAKNVVDLETRIAESHWDRVQNRDPIKTYNKATAEELGALMPHFPWSDFAAASGIAKPVTIVVRQPTYLKAFDQLFDTTPLDAWKDYCAYQLVSSYAGALSSKFDTLHFDFFDKTLRGVSEPSPRWKRGIQTLDGVLGELIGKIYVREYFKPEAKERMTALVENLRKAFGERIQGLDWMSEVTKREALAKLAKVRVKIGYPDRWIDYTKLEIRSDDLVGNLMRAGEFEYDRMIGKLGGPIDRDEWHMTPQTVNAYYNPVMNEIVFPAAILQPPFFSLDADDGVNYGSIGAVIGHELSHGFDDKGSRFDGEGNLRNWWTEEDRKSFDQRGKRLAEQYGAYAPIDNIRINGELTLGENIGDLGGVNVAFRAYQLALGDAPAPEIDGFTGSQRFFLGYAQIWRRKYRDEELRRRLLTDPHSPARFRVIGIVSNIDAFYDAFDVKPGQPMYVAPENRVRIW